MQFLNTTATRAFGAKGNELVIILLIKRKELIVIKILNKAKVPPTKLKESILQKVTIYCKDARNFHTKHKIISCVLTNKIA